VLGDPGCTIQSDLTRIADAADTSSKAGVSNLLTGDLLVTLVYTSVPKYMSAL
jgi:uncharacterized membrane protein